MHEFIEEKIEVETADTILRPLRFIWRGQTHEVTHILSERVDIGFGTLPLGSRSRTWFNRRHRRYFTVEDTAGDVFEMYFDYADKRKRTWWLVKKTSSQQAAPQTRRDADGPDDHRTSM